MKSTKEIFLRWMYIVVIALLFLPLLQYNFNLFEEKPLSGSYKKVKTTLKSFEKKELQSGTYQKFADKFWQNEHGFRNFLVRLNNQINYSLLDQSNANGTIICKENVLITEGDIKSYLGKDFIGEKRISDLLDKAKLINDTLNKRDISFFFMIAPSKASIYSDNIPAKYFELYQSESTNYDIFLNGIEERGLRLFDTKRIIQEDATYRQYPIFPKNGIHWSGNTVAKLSDTLVSFLSNELQLVVPKIKLEKGVETILDYRYTDYDIGESMNLLWNVSDDLLHYPKLTFKSVPENKPNLLGVGDSFIQSFHGFYPVIDSVFSAKSNLWYYNKTVGWPKRVEDLKIQTWQLDLELELKDRDVIILEMTEENLRMGGFDFLEALYDHFTIKQNGLDTESSKYDKLFNDATVNKESKRMALGLGYTISQAKNAIIRSKLKKEKSEDLGKEIERIIKTIKLSPTWLKSVKEKAIRKNISLEEALKEDAAWSLKRKKG